MDKEAEEEASAEAEDHQSVAGGEEAGEEETLAAARTLADARALGEVDRSGP